MDALAEAVDKLMSSDGARSCTQRYLEVRGDDGAVTLPKIGYPDADERTRLVIVLMSFFSELIKLSAKTS